MENHLILLNLLLLFLSFPSQVQSWKWFSSSSDDSSSGNQHHYHHTGSNRYNNDYNHNNNNDKPSPSLDYGAIVTEFSMEAFEDPKAIELVEYARTKLGGTNPCWLKAYQNLFASCSDIFAAEEKRKRLAWDFSNCFQLDTGMPPFPSCNNGGDKSSSSLFMVDCLRKLNSHDHKTYLEFYLQTETICYQLQSKAFKFRVEALVNDLKTSAEYADHKLSVIGENSQHLIHSSTQIKDSLTSIDIQTQQVDDTLKNMLDYIGVVRKHYKDLDQQFKAIATSQAKVLEGQGEMKEKWEQDVERIQELHHDLGKEIDMLQNKAAKAEKDIKEFGEAMFTRMNNLQGKADDIANVAGLSLDKQQMLLDGQSKALEGLKSMTKFQSQALEESRSTLQELLQFANGEREKYMQQQQELLQAHDQLALNSRSILQAQEAFQSKQASMFSALDKLLALHNALLVESRLTKAIFIYFLLMFVIYMLTSAKQTCSIRFRLFMGLLASFFLEFAMLRWTGNALAENKWLKHSFVRTIFVACAIAQLLYSYIKFRDYEALSYQMLETLMEKVKGMEKREDYCLGYDQDDDVDWITWVDTELPEDADDNEDPDYIIPDQTVKRLVVSTVTNADGRYNLRHRR